MVTNVDLGATSQIVELFRVHLYSHLSKKLDLLSLRFEDLTAYPENMSLYSFLTL
jgi:hypothetical protein